MRLINIMSTLLFVPMFVGCGLEHHDHSPKRQGAMKGNPITGELLTYLPPLEDALVKLADKSLDSQSFSQEKHWRSHGALGTRHSASASAKAGVETFQIETFAKLRKQEYVLSFRSDLLVSELDVHYRAKGEIKASLSHIQLPTTVAAELYIHLSESKAGELSFLEADNGKFIDELRIHVNEFVYEDTFLTDLPVHERELIRNKVRLAINDLLQKKNGSIAEKLNVDLNKLSAKSKIDLVSFLKEAEKKLGAKDL